MYRALWQESRLDPETSIRETLSNWSAPQSVEVLNASGDSGLAVTEMRSSFERDRRVTIRVTRRDEKQYVWVDVENFSSSTELESMDKIQSPIQDLIDDSEKIMEIQGVGEIRFQSRVQIAGPAAVKLIPQSNRKAAIICIAHDPLREEDQKKLAKLLAQQFAGSALVVYLPPGDLGGSKWNRKPLISVPRRNPDISTCYERFTECNLHPAYKCSKYSKNKT